MSRTFDAPLEALVRYTTPSAVKDSCPLTIAESMLYSANWFLKSPIVVPARVMVCSTPSWCSTNLPAVIPNFSYVVSSSIK